MARGRLRLPGLLHRSTVAHAGLLVYFPHMHTPKQGETYHHFKSADKHYEIVGIAFHTETEEDMVIYRPLYDGAIAPLFARPLSVFTSDVDKPELGYKGPRFIRVEA